LRQAGLSIQRKDEGWKIRANLPEGVRFLATAAYAHVRFSNPAKPKCVSNLMPRIVEELAWL
jgi:hypothetical protein